MGVSFQEGDSLLHVAVYNGHDDILTMLIDEFHLDFNAKNEVSQLSRCRSICHSVCVSPSRSC